MRTTLICIAVVFACLAGSMRADDSAAAAAPAVETLVPVTIITDEPAAAVHDAAITSDVPLVRSKRGLLLLKKIKLAKLGLVGLGLGAAKVAVVGSVLGGLAGGRGSSGGGQQQQHYGGGSSGGHQVSASTQYVVEYHPAPAQQYGVPAAQQW